MKNFSGQPPTPLTREIFFKKNQNHRFITSKKIFLEKSLGSIVPLTREIFRKKNKTSIDHD